MNYEFVKQFGVPSFPCLFFVAMLNFQFLFTVFFLVVSVHSTCGMIYDLLDP